VVEESVGEIPSATVVLVRLPSIGPYTAGAVACFAFERDVVAESPSTPPEEWQNHVLQRAKENGSGEYRLGCWDGYELTYEYNGYLPSIGRRL
jgi:hypothetical protein